MKKKVLLGVLACLLILTIGYTAYALSGSVTRRKYTLAYLESQGYSDTDIQNVQAKHSILSWMVSFNEWIISVEFADEPGVIYYYAYDRSSKEISQSGIGGRAAAGKDELKHAEF